MELLVIMGTHHRGEANDSSMLQLRVVALERRVFSTTRDSTSDIWMPWKSECCFVEWRALEKAMLHCFSLSCFQYTDEVEPGVSLK